MKITSISVALIACLHIGCNTVTNPEYLQEVAKVKQSAGANDIVGTWHSKTVVNSALLGTATQHKTLHFEPGGKGTIRLRGQEGPNSQVKKGETSLSWNYAGNGRWECRYGNGRGVVRHTGRRLLMESYYILTVEPSGYQMTSVTHREVFDRPGSASLNEALKKGASTKIDWIFAP